jgi:hypothetical protein
MKKLRQLVAVRTIALASITLSGTVLASTIDAFDRDWYEDNGEHVGSPNTFKDSNGNNLNNLFFTFDHANISATVTSGTARLELEAYFGFDPSEPFTSYDVIANVIMLLQTCSDCVNIYENLQSGAFYGTGFTTASDVGAIIDITLPSTAIADINAASGELFTVGVHADQVTPNSITEGVLWSR